MMAPWVKCSLCRQWEPEFPFPGTQVKAGCGGHGSVNYSVGDRDRLIPGGNARSV